MNEQMNDQMNEQDYLAYVKVTDTFKEIDEITKVAMDKLKYVEKMILHLQSRRQEILAEQQGLKAFSRENRRNRMEINDSFNAAINEISNYLYSYNDYYLSDSSRNFEAQDELNKRLHIPDRLLEKMDNDTFVDIYDNLVRSDNLKWDIHMGMQKIKENINDIQKIRDGVKEIGKSIIPLFHAIAIYELKSLRYRRIKQLELPNPTSVLNKLKSNMDKTKESTQKENPIRQREEER